MAADVEPPPPHPEVGNSEEGGVRTSCCLHKFRLYETRSKFYIIGRDKSSTFWKMLKIDRQEPSELRICEDPAAYSESESRELLKTINEENMSSGGLRFVTNCYGIVGFVKFLGPYYMLIITKRRQIGTICGHAVYAITKSKMLVLPNSSERPDTPTVKNENRYKKLLAAVDLTKDFFFSYSYHIMRSLQKNYQDSSQTGQLVYDTMFVWNEFLTRGIRNNLKNTLWTVALVHGFFRQDKISISGNDFMLTLIARRSRHYAGTRYLKRGVNEKGRVANDVETEQIVYKDVPGGCPDQITSIVQNRGSIPLYWSQETSKLNLKPDIVLQRKDQRYEATRLHFENLVKRYGNPIIILNLIKTNERKPRESKLRAEFAKAIDFINEDLSVENRLKFLHWDLNKHSRRAANVLALLSKVAANALSLTGFFYCQPTPALRLEDSLELPLLGEGSFVTWSCKSQNNRKEGNADDIGDGSQEESALPQNNCTSKLPTFQSGVLRTNCIDCLDRTNVAQYAYGLTALGHQLYTLGLVDVPKIDLDDPLADELMSFYETMGDTLAVQYTGSAAHNKIFSERRGHWKAAIQSQEFLRTLQRYYNNAYMDAEKQAAINLFLGHFQPQHGKPALWELDSDQHCSYRRWGNAFVENSRSFVKRSLSDGNILSEPDSSISGINSGLKKVTDSAMPDRTPLQDESKCLSESSPEISSCDCDISYSRYTHMVGGRQLFVNNNYHIYFNENGADGSDCSNFLDFDSLSSSGNSCEDEIYERSSLADSPVGSLSAESIINCKMIEMSPQLSTRGSSIRISQATDSSEIAPSCNLSEFPKQFVDWVMHGETFYL